MTNTVANPIENLNMNVTLDGRRLEIKNTSGSMGRGVFTVSGGADLAGLGPHVGVDADDVVGVFHARRENGGSSNRSPPPARDTRPVRRAGPRPAPPPAPSGCARLS